MGLHTICALALRNTNQKVSEIASIMSTLIKRKIVCCKDGDINRRFSESAHLNAVSSVMVMRTRGVHRRRGGGNVDDVRVHQLIFLVQQVKDPDSV